jgi:hypothetical protein
MGAVGSGGCLGLSEPGGPLGPPDSDGDGVPDGRDDFPENPRYAFERIEEDRTVRVDGYHQVASGTDLTETVELSISVQSGPAVNVLAHQPADFDKYDGPGDRDPVPMLLETDLVEATVSVGIREIEGAAVYFFIENPPTAGGTAEVKYTLRNLG